MKLQNELHRVDLQMITGPELSIGGVGPLIGEGSAVALEHDSRPPAEQSHGIALTAPRSQPTVSRTVPELMCMEERHPCITASAPNHLGHARGGERALGTHPQLRQICVRMMSTNAQVAGQGLIVLAPKGTGRGRLPLPTTTTIWRSTSKSFT